MNDFKSYQKRSTEEKPADWTKEAQKVAAAYHGKSEGDMMKEIYARAVEGKRNGTLNNAQIDAFYAQFAPMLDGAKKKKLKKLVEQLKSM